MYVTFFFRYELGTDARGALLGSAVFLRR